MKCPGCGAETQGKFCEYCGSEMLKEKTNVGVCPKCGGNNVSFKRERVGTATQRTSNKNIIGTGRTGHSVSQSVYRTIGVCQGCGYTWNPNAARHNSGKRIWLWVLGWICIFPVPLTILMLRKKDMKPVVKYGIIATAWLLFFVIGLSGNSETDTDTSQNDVSKTTVQVEQATNTTTETDEAIDNKNLYARQEKTIRRFVSEFNEISDTPITDIKFKNNHTVAYLLVDGFGELGIKVNDHREMGFFFTFEFSNGIALLEQYENLMRDVVKVFDANVDVGEKFQEANMNEETMIYLSDNISVKYNYIKDAVGFQAADTYIITLTSMNYNKQ